ncbi:hypothetical protein N7478_013244 [Penicillium angulare]|uniref:uncharacterized protein n=1 Tax=Penicillium angulare TaxID=116970 RepID=UPI0025421076|nr:uncharacterized protein N7478_013244 [Penicillium angulare]KAJ5257140.1 hypothetical protein N7478_013244 [Penicillium angulare]
MLLKSIYQLSIYLQIFTLATATPTPTPATNDHHPTLYLIRHGEKPSNPENHELTFDGLKRAQCLRWIFNANSAYDVGLILAPTMKDNGEHGRSFKTVKPLARDLGLQVDLHCGRKEAECVADAIRTYNGTGNILVAWRHKNMVEIQQMLGVVDPIEYPEDRFDLSLRIPYPYDTITEIKSEECPGLDTPGLVVQY